jgi:hypothetical protein
MAAKAVLAAEAVTDGPDINLPGSGATIHVWWLWVALVMSLVFSWFEHSLCLAWIATFRGEHLIELGQLQARQLPAADTEWFRSYYIRDNNTAGEGLTTEPLLDTRLSVRVPPPGRGLQRGPL